MPLGGPGVSSGRWGQLDGGPIEFDNPIRRRSSRLQDGNPTVTVQRDGPEPDGVCGGRGQLQGFHPNAVDHDVAVFYNTADGSGSNGGTAPDGLLLDVRRGEGDHTAGFDLGGRKRGHH